jgi:hypothetical protein
MCRQNYFKLSMTVNCNYHTKGFAEDDLLFVIIGVIVLSFQKWLHGAGFLNCVMESIQCVKKFSVSQNKFLV